MNPYHDKRGRFTNAANASTRTGKNAPTYGRGKPNARNGIQRWSKDELAEPRRVPKVIQDQKDKIAAIKKQAGDNPTEQDRLRIAFADKMPTGKTQTLYHHTTPEKAAKIMRSGFKPLSGKGIQQSRAKDGIADVTWFHDRQHHQIFEGFAGSALLSVRVPRKDVVRRQLNVGDELMVKHSTLKGRTIKRIK